MEASGVDAAVDALKVLTTGESGSKPQSTNMKAAFAAFQEAELPKLKEENPRLKKSQYDEQLSKMWKKDSRNPRTSPRSKTAVRRERERRTIVRVRPSSLGESKSDVMIRGGDGASRRF